MASANPPNPLVLASQPMLFKVFLLVIAVLAVKLLWRTYFPVLRGRFGEKLVADTLAELPEDYRVINNLMVRTNWGTAQIDHVVICPHGIFVIETKTYNGWIFGSETDAYWTQVIHHRKKRFYNPLRQNNGHVQALKTILAGSKNTGYKNIVCYSIVVFSGECELKKSIPGVMYRQQLNAFILSKRSGHPMSRSDDSWILSVLLQANIRDRETKRQHRESVRMRKVV